MSRQHRSPTVQSFFHVDRGSRLQAGVPIQRQPVSFSGTQAPSTVARDLFNSSLSEFGQRHMMPTSPFGPNAGKPVPHFFTEHVYEAVRIAGFPSALSRFQAVFGCTSIEDARAFATGFPGTAGPPVPCPIWRVEVDRAELRDMRLMAGTFSFPYTLDTALSYWRGEHSQAPLIEALMEPPVTPVEIVQHWQP